MTEQSTRHRHLEVHEGLEGVVAFSTEIAEPDKEGSALRLTVALCALRFCSVRQRRCLHCSVGSSPNPPSPHTRFG